MAVFVLALFVAMHLQPATYCTHTCNLRPTAFHSSLPPSHVRKREGGREERLEGGRRDKEGGRQREVGR